MMTPQAAGELAALSVSVLWTCGTMLFAWSAKRVGPDATNLVRITIAAMLLACILTAVHGAPYPVWASAGQLVALTVSGFLGLVFGDGCYFRALALIGPRRSTLLMALAPALTAVLGWGFLGERLGLRALAGMALTLAGTAWVVAERTPDASTLEALHHGRHTVLGSLYGFGGALGQAAGLVMAKGAMRGIDPLSAAAARMTAATAFVWIIAAIGGKARAHAAKIAFPGLLPRIFAAALVGPVFGVWLSLYAAAHTETAVAATLMALVPILILPVVRVIDKERISARAMAGAIVAVLGVVLLVTRG